MLTATNNQQHRLNFPTNEELQNTGTQYRKILPKDAPKRSNVDFLTKSNIKKLPSRLYKCSECPESFNAFRQLRTHELVHAASVANVCQYCCTIFTNTETLEKHQNTFHEGAKYKCPPCGKEYSNKGHLLKHAYAMHQRKTLQFYCSLCVSTAVNFTSRIELQQHFQQTHLSASIDEDDMKIEMNEEFLDEFLLSDTSENFEFSECWEALDLHLPDMLPLAATDGSHNTEQSVAAFKCPKCYEECTSQKSLLLHLAHRHALKVLICCKCETSFDDLGQLRQHKATHCLRDKSPKRVNQIDMCETAFSTHTASDCHNKTLGRNLTRSSHECPYCGKSFVAVTNFKKHLRTVHSLLKRHICQLCDKQFATLDHLKKHVLSQHQNERKHICHVCAKRFTQLCHLKQHLAIHTTGKPLQCDLCETTFWRKIDLERHTLTKHT